MSATGRVLLALIAVYRRAVSPLLGPRCRFLPTCSAYAAAVVRDHGAGRGTLLAVRRVLRCHPWHPGGLDPAPPPPAGSATMETTSLPEPRVTRPGAPAC